MKRRLTTISVLFAFAASVLLAQSGGAVEGMVVDSATGAGISGVSVYFGTDDGTHYETATADSGAFRIEGMKPGKYGSHYEKAVYLPYYSGQDPAASPVQAASGGNPHPIRIQLSAPATLSGRVLDPDGKPANARVDLDLLKEAVTDRDGHFLFTSLAPGEHALLATPLKPAAPPVRAPQEARKELVPTWFPSTIDADQAQKIAVTSGAAVSDIEIRLQRTPVYRVQGTVLSAAGKPLTETTVMMVSGGRHETLTGIVQKGDIAFFPLGIPGPAVPFEAVSSARTNEGAFEFPAVPSGDWRFVAINDGRDQAGGPPSFATVPVFVGHDIDDLQIRFAAPFQWIGSVEWLGLSDSKRTAKLTVMLAAEDNWLTGGGNESDGILRFDNVRPGQYRNVPPPGAAGNYYLSSALVGEREVLGQPVELFPGSPPLRILYKPNAGTVRGTVDNCETGTVVLAPERALTDLTQDFGRFSSCGPEGEFSIGSMRPDDYYIWALDTADPKKFADAKILQKLIPKAVRVTVAEGGTASVHLSITHAAVP